MDHLEEARFKQVARLRAMTPDERWRAAHRLYWSARRLKAAYVRWLHPEWDDATVAAAVREAFVNARS